MKRLVILFAIAIGLCNCQQTGTVYNEHQDLSPKLEWLKKDSRIFKVPITDNSIAYNLSLSFRYVNGLEYNVVKVKVTETSPSGVQTVNEYDLKVRNEKGDYIGEFAYEIWDSKHKVESSKKYTESGNFTYEIEHNMPMDPISSVMEIGLILEKAE